MVGHTGHHVDALPGGPSVRAGIVERGADEVAELAADQTGPGQDGAPGDGIPAPRSQLRRQIFARIGPKLQLVAGGIFVVGNDQII